METSKLIARYIGADARHGYRTGEIYILKMISGDYWVTIWRVKPWYKFWTPSGFAQYIVPQAEFVTNWEVLENA